MKSIACMTIGSLLSKRASGLSGAERLRLEEHLQTCASCRDDAYALDAITSLTRSPELPSLTSRARERAIAGALMHATRLPSPELMPTRSRRPLLAWAGVSLMAAAAAAVILVVANGSDGETRRAGVAADDDALLVAGDITTGGDAIEVGNRIEPGAAMATSEGARLIVGRAEIEIQPASEIAWLPEDETIALRAGTIRASVASDPNRTFRVTTETFAVEVVGTKFEVTPDSVEVFEGTVRIVAADGDVLVAALTEGETWQAGIAAADQPAKKRARKRPRKRSKPAAAATVEVDVAVLLASARSHLAAKSVSSATEDIQRALDADPSRRQQAEAYSLIAECALVAGEPDKAARLYLQVSDNYRGLSAAENALFAAARIEANAGNRDAAREHLERYLERYPEGRFQAEAERRLTELP